MMSLVYRGLYLQLEIVLGRVTYSVSKLVKYLNLCDNFRLAYSAG